MKKYVDSKILRYLFLISALFIFSFSNWAIFAEEKETDNDILKWLPYNQGLVKSKVENIPTLIYFYSDNCGWCRKLENETFTNQNIKEIMSNYFSIIRINSNSIEAVIENGEEITEKELSNTVYQVRGNPTIWFLSQDNERIAPLPGFVEADVFINILNYIKDDYYKEVTFQEYMGIQNI